MILMLNRFSLFFIVFIISGCSQPNLSDYPTWYTENEQNQNDEIYYAKGIGDSKLAATYIALDEIAAQINLSISSNYAQETKRTADDYSYDSTKRILVTTEDIKLNGYQVLNEYQVETGSLWWKKITYFVSISVDKDKIIKNIIHEIIDLAQEINTLSNQIESNCYQGDYELFEKKIKSLISNGKILKSLNPTLENDNQMILNNAQKVLNYTKMRPFIVIKKDSSDKYHNQLSSYGIIVNEPVEGKYFIMAIHDLSESKLKINQLNGKNKKQISKNYMTRTSSEFTIYDCKNQILYKDTISAHAESSISKEHSIDKATTSLMNNFYSSNLNTKLKDLIK